MFNPAETIRQIVKTLYPYLSSSSTIASIDELHALISAQLSRAPRYIYLAMMFLTGLFNLLPLLKWGATFRTLPAERQRLYTLAWKNSPVKMKRDFINFFESFVILGIYEVHDTAGPAASQSCMIAERNTLPGTRGRP